MNAYATFEDLIYEARQLKSEDGENPEYDRALCELIARAFPIFDMPTFERAQEIRKELEKN